MTAMLEGIDVSNFQRAVDWEKVAGLGAGKAGKQNHFAFVKASEGEGFRDQYFVDNWPRSRASGLLRGAYHYLHPSLSAVEQADWFHKCVREGGHFGENDVAVIDLEVTDGQSPVAVVNCAAAFALRIQRTVTPGDLPVQVILYTGADFWLHTLGNPVDPVLAACPLWLADYTASASYLPVLRNWPHGASFWQFTDAGTVYGVLGNVDRDIFFGGPDQLARIFASPEAP